MRRRSMVSVLVFVLAVLSGGAGRANPDIVDLPNTPLASSNVRHLARIPTGVSVGGHFVGKYFFLTAARPGGITGPGAGSGGVYAFDATVPETPKLVGFLPLPHWQNEDVDVSPQHKILLVTSERLTSGNCEGNVERAGLSREDCVVTPPTLYVVDISDPANMRVRSQLEMPIFAGRNKAGAPFRGPGHTATCVLGCAFAYVSSSRFNQGVYVIDLRDLDSPKVHGQVWNSPAGLPNKQIAESGMIHDAHVDRFGNMWLVGTSGTAMYAPVTNPLRPKLLAYGKARDDRYNGLIHHGALRLDRSHVVVGEESYAGQCGHKRDTVDEQLRDDDQQGSFQAWRISRTRLVPVGMWKTEAESHMDGGGLVILACSAHWFSLNQHRIAAVGWYSQGVRFLDVSNPSRIRQVGYWIGAGSTHSAAYFVPWRPDIVYAADYYGGLDVLQIDRGGRRAATVVAPMRAEWFADYAGVRFAPALRPDPDWGYACARPASLDG